MARTKISEFSATPANNTDIDSINLAEGCAPSGINDAIRELMAQLKDFQTGAVGDSFNGPVGTTTAAAGAFTTLSASSTATLNTLASSGATLTGGTINGMTIGATTASTGAFTTLSASSTVTLSGGTANGVSYLNSSKVLTTGSALTFAETSNETKLGIKSISGTSSYTAGIAVNWDENAFILYGGSGYKLLETVGYATPSALKFFASNSEQMRLTSTGLGIGTSSPSAKLDVRGNATFTGNGTSRQTADFTNTGGQLYVGAESSAGGAVFVGSSAYAGIVGTNTSTPLQLGTNGTIKATLDSSGNLGLGVTPSATNSTYFKSLEVGRVGQGVTTATNSLTSSPTTWLSNNSYATYSSGIAWLYANSQPAALYRLEDAAHKWYTAPSGTAGNAITFTQAMSLDSSGNLLVGGTSNTFVSRAVLTSTSTNNVLELVQGVSAGYSVIFTNTSGVVGSITTTSSATAYNTSSDYRLKNVTGALTGYKERLMSLQPKQGTWIVDGSEFRGFLAHDFAVPYRASVTGEKDAVDANGNPVMQAMQASSSEVMADLVAMVKDLITENASLKARLDAANL